MNILKINKEYLILICLFFFQFNSWSQIKKLNFESKNTPPCLSDITIDQDVLSGDTDLQDAEHTITATNEIFNGGIAAYDAGSSVTMTIGFNAKAGSEFRAFIEGCTPSLINCTEVFNPEDEAEDVSITSSLMWTGVENATGYVITIGTSAGASDVLENFNINETTYVPENDWEVNTTYFVTVTPFNETESADSCLETSFTTEIPDELPSCVTVSSPLDGAEGLPINITLSWQPIETATGYKITIGTSSGETDVENNRDLGNVTTYTPSSVWLEETTYYVTVTPYNTFGDALNCQETSFTIRGALFIPNAFTPDNDGINDTFNIVNVDLIYPNYKILIYDRWGNVVYKGKNGWNGIAENFRSIGSKKVIQGVYYVLVFLGNEEVIKKTLVVEY